MKGQDAGRGSNRNARGQKGGREKGETSAEKKQRLHPDVLQELQESRNRNVARPLGSAAAKVSVKEIILVFKICLSDKCSSSPLLILVAGVKIPAGKPSYLLQEIPRHSRTRWEI